MKTYTQLSGEVIKGNENEIYLTRVRSSNILQSFFCDEEKPYYISSYDSKLIHKDESYEDAVTMIVTEEKEGITHYCYIVIANCSGTFVSEWEDV